MFKKKNTRPTVGDIFEIQDEERRFYLVFTHETRDYGDVVLVYPYVSTTAISDVPSLFSECHDCYYILFPIKQAVRSGEASKVGRRNVADDTFPLFKVPGNRDRTTGAVVDWWLWDGEREWQIGSLSDEERALPTRAIWNLAVLIDRVGSGWRPEEDARR